MSPTKFRLRETSACERWASARRMTKLSSPLCIPSPAHAEPRTSLCLRLLPTALSLPAQKHENPRASNGRGGSNEGKGPYAAGEATGDATGGSDAGSTGTKAANSSWVVGGQNVPSLIAWRYWATTAITSAGTTP